MRLAEWLKIPGLSLKAEMGRCFYVWQSYLAVTHYVLDIIVSRGSIGLGIVFIAELTSGEGGTALWGRRVIFWVPILYNLLKCSIALCRLPSWTNLLAGSHRVSTIWYGHLLIWCLNRVPCFTVSDSIKVILLRDILECLYLSLRWPLCRRVLLTHVPGGIGPAHHEFSGVIKLLMLLRIWLFTLSEASTCTLEGKILTLRHTHVEFWRVKGRARVKVWGDLIVFVTSRILRGRLWSMRGGRVQVRCGLLLRHKVFLLRDEVGGWLLNELVDLDELLVVVGVPRIGPRGSSPVPPSAPDHGLPLLDGDYVPCIALPIDYSAVLCWSQGVPRTLNIVVIRNNRCLRFWLIHCC